jgi:hypothetical protein
VLRKLGFCWASKEAMMLCRRLHAVASDVRRVSRGRSPRREESHVCGCRRGSVFVVVVMVEVPRGKRERLRAVVATIVA